MIFIIVLIALIMERFFHWHHLRHWRWVIRYETIFPQFLYRFPSMLVFITSLLLPVLLVGFISYMLRDKLFGLPEFIFGVLIILYCLGPENLWVQVYANHFQVSENEKDPIVFIKAIFIAAEQRIFAVLFWFVLLGPMGAVLYRLTDIISRLETLPFSSTARSLKHYLEWLPVRLMAFLFALGGHFMKTFNVLKSYALQGVQANDVLLTECGLAALDIQEESMPEKGIAEEAALALLDRVGVLALFLLALCVLIFI